jgi:indole-3-glycerol phosphate synthase
MYKQTQIIAEVKTQSPFGFKSEKSWDELFAIADSVGDILSIHTDARWGGSFDLIQKAKSLTNKPILAKGIHATADYILVVGRIPLIHQERCLIEPRTLAELKTIPLSFKVVWNSRDLSDGGLKRETFKDARSVFGGWMCQASNIRTVADIEDGADAVLVGTYIHDFALSCTP